MISRVLLQAGDSLVVIKRNKNGERFIALPGGHIEPGETPEAAVTREAEEELSVRLERPRLLYIYMSKQWGIQYFYHAIVSTQVRLAMQLDSTEFKDTEVGDNTYEPCWLQLAELASELVYPPEVLDRFIDDLAHDSLPDDPVLIESAVTEDL